MGSGDGIPHSPPDAGLQDPSFGMIQPDTADFSWRVIKLLTLFTLVVLWGSPVDILKLKVMVSLREDLTKLRSFLGMN